MLVRRSTYLRVQAELAATREAYERQQATLVQDIKDTFEDTITRNVRSETKEERLRYSSQRDRFDRLIRAAQVFIPEYRLDASLPAISEDEARAQIRGVLRELERERRPDGVQRGEFVK